MNNDFPIDPKLKSLEARLSALRPKLLDREAQELLYQCAFTAGRKLATRQTRRWQFASAAMAVVLLGVSVSLVKERAIVAEREPGILEHAGTVQAQTPQQIAHPGHRGAVSLDAWQIRTDDSVRFETALNKFKQMDANSRSFAVGHMSRAAGNMP